METRGPARLLDGYYRVNGTFAQSWRVDGDSVEVKDAHNSFDYRPRIEYGDFGDAHESVTSAVGAKCKYNLKYTSLSKYQAETTGNGDLKQVEVEELGVIIDGGRKCYLKGLAVYNIEKITDEEFDAMENDYDPIEAPPGPYTLQPHNQGRILLLCGPPGTGKSTTAQLLARRLGYVYYECDTFAQLKNPFIDVNVDNPSIAQLKQKILKGPGDKERVQLMRRANTVWGPLVAGLEYDKDVLKEFFSALCHDINTQKQRIGGHWAIAQLAFKRDIRDVMREILGPQLTFVNLRMSKQHCLDRLMSRHEGGDQKLMERFEKFMEVFDIGDDPDEPNVIHIDVRPDMSREEVVQETLKKI